MQQRGTTCGSIRRAECSVRRIGRVSAAAVSTADAPASLAFTRPTLLDMPVSNHGARVRHVIYAKALEHEYDIKPPSVLGGLKSPAYLALNPEGRMPVLALPNGLALPESEVIVQYLLEVHDARGPPLRAPTPELRAREALATRIHDLYIAPVQGCMYKAMPALQRSQQLATLAAQLDILEGLVAGPFVAGAPMTSADSALFPTFVFMRHMLPRHFGWAGVFEGRPKLAAWWAAVERDAAAARVIEEVQEGLNAWEARGRWAELGITQQVAEGEHRFAY